MPEKVIRCWGESLCKVKIITVSCVSVDNNNNSPARLGCPACGLKDNKQSVGESVNSATKAAALIICILKSTALFLFPRWSV